MILILGVFISLIVVSCCIAAKDNDSDIEPFNSLDNFFEVKGECKWDQDPPIWDFVFFFLVFASILTVSILISNLIC